MTSQWGHESSDGQRLIDHIVLGNSHLTAFHLDNAINGLHQILVAGTDSHDIVTVVSHRACNGAVLDVEATHHAHHRTRMGLVAVQHDNLLDLGPRIAGVFKGVARDGDHLMACVEAAVGGTHDVHGVGGLDGGMDIFHCKGTGNEIVGILVGAVDAIIVDGRQQRAEGGVAVIDLDALDDGLQHTEVGIQRVNGNEVGLIALLQHTPVKMVVTLGIDTGSHEDVPEVVALGKGTLHQEVDMSAYEVVGVTVVSTQHHHIGRLFDERTELGKVLGSAALADDDLHARRYAGTALVEVRALMVGSDTCQGIALALVAHQSGSMTIHRLTVGKGCLQLAHHLRVGTKHTRVVHHLAQNADFIACHELFHTFSVNHGTAGLDAATTGRHTTGRSETVVERRQLARVDHIVDALDAQHVAYLMRIGHHADGAVTGSHTGKLAGGHHATLNVHMTVDEAWHQVRILPSLVRQLAGLHLDDTSIVHYQFAIENLAAHHINDMSLILFHHMIVLDCYVFFSSDYKDTAPKG